MQPYMRTRGGMGPIRGRKLGFWDKVSESINEPTSKTAMELQGQIKVGALSVLWVISVFWMIFYGVPLLKRGVIFSHSTLEQCKIVSYVENECQYNCHCDYAVGPNGDHQRFCKKCDGKQYIYTATAERKCGLNRLLIQTKHENVCPEKLHAKGHVIECYVPDCHYGTFTYHTHARIIVEAVSLSIICFSIILWVPYTLFQGHKDSKFTR